MSLFVLISVPLISFSLVRHDKANMCIIAEYEIERSNLGNALRSVRNS
jgi:hypothetical protein